MKLSEYLAAKDESQESFAARASRHRPTGTPISQRTISRIVNGSSCNAATARAIILASREEPAPDGGTVTLDDLVVGEERDGEGAAA